MARILQISFISVLLVAVGILTAYARESYYIYNSRQPHHYLSVSIGTGEANNIKRASRDNRDSIQTRAGAAVNLSLHYEVQYRSWMFGVAITGEYQHLRDAAPSAKGNKIAFTDTETRKYNDPHFQEQDPITYYYDYSGYIELSHTVHGAVSLYVGKEFIYNLYAIAGAKLSVPIYKAYNVQAQISTRVHYHQAMSEIKPDLLEGSGQQEDVLREYGVFREQEYEKSFSYKDYAYKDYVRVAPYAEFGWYIPTLWQKTRLRTGLYATYGFCLQKTSKHAYPLADYSDVCKEYGAGQSTQMLQNAIFWHPLIESSKYKSVPDNFEIGAKLTILFDVTVEKKICKCYPFWK